jgi:hypothetical protein
MCPHPSKPIFWSVLAAVLVACGGSDLMLPADGSPASLRAVSGDGQQGKVGTQLPDPLVVRLTDGAAHPVSGVAIAFRFQTDVPAARVDPTTTTTNDSGFASVRARLGTTTGPQTIEARLADDAASDLLATFGLTALPQHGGNGDGGGDGDD